MAMIGMKNFTIAPVATYTPGTGITYSTGMLVPHARRGSVTYNWADAELYGDDVLAESYSGISDYDIEVETTEMSDAAMTMLGLETAVGTTDVTYELVANPNTWVGCGFIQVLMVDGTKSYRAFWFYRVKFSPDGEEANTKEKDISFATPTIKGKGTAVILNSAGTESVRVRQDFASEADALAFLKTKAGIT